MTETAAAAAIETRDTKLEIIMGRGHSISSPMLRC